MLRLRRHDAAMPRRHDALRRLATPYDATTPCDAATPCDAYDATLRRLSDAAVRRSDALRRLSDA
jgi:hypothetical protein